MVTIASDSLRPHYAPHYAPPLCASPVVVFSCPVLIPACRGGTSAPVVRVRNVSFGQRGLVAYIIHSALGGKGRDPDASGLLPPHWSGWGDGEGGMKPYLKFRSHLLCECS